MSKGPRGAKQRHGTHQKAKKSRVQLQMGIIGVKAEMLRMHSSIWIPSTCAEHSPTIGTA
eukprot:1153275-Pelagomonas_calceolata.AAC.1